MQQGYAGTLVRAVPVDARERIVNIKMERSPGAFSMLGRKSSCGLSQHLYSHAEDHEHP